MTEAQKRNIRLFKEALKEAIADYTDDVIDEITEDYEGLDPEIIALTDIIATITNYTEA